MGNLKTNTQAGDERGVLVGNAEERLVAHHKSNIRPHHHMASGFAADGVLEGLAHHFNIGLLGDGAPAAKL